MRDSTMQVVQYCLRAIDSIEYSSRALRKLDLRKFECAQADVQLLVSIFSLQEKEPDQVKCAKGHKAKG